MDVLSAVERFLIVDVVRRRWWWDLRWLPPESDPEAREAVLHRLRVAVANAFHDSGVLDFAVDELELVEPDENGWRDLPAE